uniref:Xyloglucan endotransglucosylase/hydrolase n=1 Tax=Aegilops tauschii subsp. strangulata TaxID=200361 RepID=A0A453CTU1_AEGTS
DRLEVNWGRGSHGTVSADGQVISLSLDRNSGSGFRSRDTYLYARIDLQIKLAPGNSAGTVTTCYFLSEGSWANHDEIDLEFLGNSTGEPYTLHTNVYINGTGSKEQQFHLWFDPTADFHTYSIVWTPLHLLLWNAEDWATQGGRVKTDWSLAPFVAQYRNFTATTSSPGAGGGYYDQELDATAQQAMKWARDKYMVYNYCADSARFPYGSPPECYMP